MDNVPCNRHLVKGMRAPTGSQYESRWALAGMPAYIGVARFMRHTTTLCVTSWEV